MKLEHIIAQALIDHSTTIPGGLEGYMQCAKCRTPIYKQGVKITELQSRVALHQSKVLAELINFARAYEHDTPITIQEGQ